MTGKLISGLCTLSKGGLSNFRLHDPITIYYACCGKEKLDNEPHFCSKTICDVAPEFEDLNRYHGCLCLKFPDGDHVCEFHCKYNERDVTPQPEIIKRLKDR